MQYKAEWAAWKVSSKEPTITAHTLTNQATETLDKLIAAWIAVKTAKLSALNQQLQSAGEPPTEIATPASAPRPQPGNEPKN